MRLFKCPACRQILYFENTHCMQCGHALGFDPQSFAMHALAQAGEVWQDSAQTGLTWRFCDNQRHGACNWLLPADSAQSLCVACQHNHTIPDLDVAENKSRWLVLEQAKHRLFYALLRLRLPLATRRTENPHGLAFDFPAETAEKPHVMTGHDEGLITIALKEGDSAEREKLRRELGELYRTPLGHFRHEIGHYYWDVLVRNSAALEQCRTLFGDDRADYAEALQQHYANPPASGWQENYVSAYATSHPWEDFAESWAHYLHIIDTLEMASAFGMSIDPGRLAPALATEIDFDPYTVASIDRIMAAWLPLTVAVNSLNRAMGQPDLYPFILSSAVIKKLDFIHQLAHQSVT